MTRRISTWPTAVPRPPCTTPQSLLQAIQHLRLGCLRSMLNGFRRGWCCRNWATRRGGRRYARIGACARPSASSSTIIARGRHQTVAARIHRRGSGVAVGAGDRHINPPRDPGPWSRCRRECSRARAPDPVRYAPRRTRSSRKPPRSSSPSYPMRFSSSPNVCTDRWPPDLCRSSSASGRHRRSSPECRRETAPPPRWSS